MGDTNQAFAKAHNNTGLTQYSTITPVGELDGNNMIAFTSRNTGPEGIETNEFVLVSAEDMESYRGSNHISLSRLSTDGITEYRYGAVLEAFNTLPETMQLNLSIGDGSAEIFASLQLGNISGDNVDLLLEEGDLLGFLNDLKLIASNRGEWDSIGLNEQSAAELASKVDAAILKLEIAANLPGYQSALRDSLENGDAAKAGVPEAHIAAALSALEGQTEESVAQPAPKVGND